MGLFRVKIGDLNILMLSNATKKCDENVMLSNTNNGKTCCW